MSLLFSGIWISHRNSKAHQALLDLEYKMGIPAQFGYAKDRCAPGTLGRIQPGFPYIRAFFPRANGVELTNVAEAGHLPHLVSRETHSNVVGNRWK